MTSVVRPTATAGAGASVAGDVLVLVELVEHVRLDQLVPVGGLTGVGRMIRLGRLDRLDQLVRLVRLDQLIGLGRAFRLDQLGRRRAVWLAPSAGSAVRASALRASR